MPNGHPPDAQLSTGVRATSDPRARNRGGGRRRRRVRREVATRRDRPGSSQARMRLVPPLLPGNGNPLHERTGARNRPGWRVCRAYHDRGLPRDLPSPFGYPCRGGRTDVWRSRGPPCVADRGTGRAFGDGPGVGRGASASSRSRSRNVWERKSLPPIFGSVRFTARPHWEPTGPPASTQRWVVSVPTLSESTRSISCWISSAIQ